MADSYIQKQDKHQVYLSRLAGGILKEDVYPGINNAYRSVYSILRDHGDISSIRELNQVTKAITAAIKESVGEGFAAATTSMSAIAVNEAAYQAAALSLMSDTVLKAPGEPRVNKYTRESIMSLTSGKRVTSGVWPSFVKGYEDSMSREYNSIITAAYSESLSTGKMATLNQLSQRLRNANNELLARDAEALVRTGVQHYAGKASQLMAADNSDIIEREIPIVTFDSRTTDICISISAKYPKGWPLGKSPIGYSPYHYNAVVAGEMVKTSGGNKKIEDVAVGDLVVTHKGRLKPVTAVMRKPCDTGFARRIHFESGLAIMVTDEHPLLVDGFGWVRADEVKVGHNLFKNVKKVSKLFSRSPVAEWNPNNYPSIFDGDEVFSEVASFSGAMSSAVDFNADSVGLKSKIHDSIIANKLVRKIVSAIGANTIVNKCLLAFNRIGSMPIALTDHKRRVTSFIMKRVGFLHSLRMRFMNLAGFLGKPISPMPLTLSGFLKRPSYAASLAPTHWFNTVNPAPSTHGSVSEGELSFDSSKGFLQGVIMKIKKFSKIFFINKFNHWESQVVKSISIVEHKGMVYNLEVKDDHTYLINDIVTHNCRTTIGYLLKGQTELEGTRSAKGSDGGSQIAANTPFAKFLREQPKDYIYETLGRKRGELFVAGKLPLANLTDKYLNPLPISKLNLTD